MKDDTDTAVFMFKIYQLSDEVRHMDKVVSTGRLTATILNALPAEKYSTRKIQANRDHNFCLVEIRRALKPIFNNHSERSSVTKMNQGPYGRSWEKGRELTMSSVVTSHLFKKPR